MNLLFLIKSESEHNNSQYSFKGLKKALSKASESYRNFILMDDFNVNINSPSVERDMLDKLCIVF